MHHIFYQSIIYSYHDITMNRWIFPLSGILLVSKNLNMITIDITSIDIALHDTEIEKK